MKRILQLLVFTLMVAGCSGDESGTSCAELTSLNITQQIDKLQFSLSGETSEALYYEIAYAEASANPSPTNSNTFVINSTQELVDVRNLVFSDTDRNMVFFARAVCAEGNSEWIGPKSLLVTDFCEKPENIEFFFDELRWDTHEGDSHWQVQYGVEGFTLGSGTVKTVNVNYLEDIQMSANTTYDFYVRSNCSGQTGWSAWAGPYSYFSPTNHNLCIIPSNVTFTVARNGANQAIGANVKWDTNGEMNFEHVMLPAGNTPNSTTWNSSTYPGFPTYTSMTQNADYHFYVRAVCSNGSKTAWFGPTTVNIGN
jgi:hypothetical protein